MDNQTGNNTHQLAENIQHEIKDGPEKHDVHAEGKVEKESSLSSKVIKEGKRTVPGGDKIGNGNGEEISLNLTNAKVTLKNEKELGNQNVQVSENITSNKRSSTEERIPKRESSSKRESVSRRETVPKREPPVRNGNLPKAEKCDANETIPKSIGDRKRVKFLVDDEIKTPRIHNAQRVKPRETKDVHAFGGTFEPKRQLRTTDKARSPIRNKSKDRSRLINNDGSKVVIKRKSEAQGDINAEDSGEENWSKPNTDNSQSLNKDSENLNVSTRKSYKNSCGSSDGTNNVKHRMNRGISSKNKEVSPGPKKTVKAGKRSNDGSQKNSGRVESESESSDTDSDTIKKQFTYSIDLADMESSESEEFSYEKNDSDDESSSENSQGSTNNKESVKNDEPTSVPDSNNKTSNDSPPGGSQVPCNENQGCFAYMVDTFTHSPCYRITLCVGWMLWAAWIMRLMGIHVLSQLDVTGLVTSVGLLQFMGIVEAFGLLQVLWLGFKNWRRPAPTAAAAALVLDPDPDPATQRPKISYRASAPGLTNRKSINHVKSPNTYRNTDSQEQFTTNS